VRLHLTAEALGVARLLARTAPDQQRGRGDGREQ
jgi:hypothetical protein